MDSSAQVAAKQQQLLEELARIGHVTPEAVLPPLTAATTGYRRRARVGARYVEKKGKVVVGFREKEGSLITDVTRCEVLAAPVADLPGKLSTLFTTLAARERLPQVEVSVGEGRPVLVLRHLVPLVEDDLTKLRAFGEAEGMDWWLQPEGPDSIAPLNPDAPRHLQYSLPAEDVRLDFLPLDFIQVNGPLNRAMVAHALRQLDVQPGDSVLDLFCGLGNFTLPLARRAREVHGVEGEAGLVARARANAEANGLTNVTFSVANLFEPVSDFPWAKRHWDKVLLDPARAGAREILPMVVAAKPSRIVYVSCHPGSLARDAGILVHELGYVNRAAGIMDMFPHTGHVESIAVFEPAPSRRG
jgi:23S rRNA (uracil1939-C5)-methyltransferase